LLLTALFLTCASNRTNAQTAQTLNLNRVTSYFVRANGNDSNVGTSENAPFRTLAKAVEAASKTKVKTITVIGTLIGQTEISNSGVDEILITGKHGASDSEKAALTTLTEKTNTIQITGNSNIKLEYLTVMTGSTYSIIYAEGNEVKLTLGKDAVVFGNGEDVEYLANAGGGILMIKGTLIIMDNAAVTNCLAELGGGIAVSDGVKMVVQDNAVISNNMADDSGGGVCVLRSNLEIKNNAIIRGNTANYDSIDSGGGGIYCSSGTIKLHDNSSVTGNFAPYGGGIFLQMSSIQTEDSVEAESSGTYESRNVSGNTATKGFYTRQEISHNIFVNNY